MEPLYCQTLWNRYRDEPSHTRSTKYPPAHFFTLRQTAVRPPGHADARHPRMRTGDGLRSSVRFRAGLVPVGSSRVSAFPSFPHRRCARPRLPRNSTPAGRWRRLRRWRSRWCEGSALEAHPSAETDPSPPPRSSLQGGLTPPTPPPQSSPPLPERGRAALPSPAERSGARTHTPRSY